MCENCMTYNKQDTIYYHAARKLLDFGLKLLSRVSLRSAFAVTWFGSPGTAIVLGKVVVDEADSEFYANAHFE